jgi:hypothetical protein
MPRQKINRQAPPPDQPSESKYGWWLSSPSTQYAKTGHPRYLVLAIGTAMRSGAPPPEWALNACSEYAAQYLGLGYRPDEEQLGDDPFDGVLLDLIAYRMVMRRDSLRKASLFALGCAGLEPDDSHVRRLARLWKKSLDRSESQGRGRTNRWLRDSCELRDWLLTFTEPLQEWYAEQVSEIVKTHGPLLKLPFLIPGLPLPKHWT